MRRATLAEWCLHRLCTYGRRSAKRLTGGRRFLGQFTTDANRHVHRAGYALVQRHRVASGPTVDNGCWCGSRDCRRRPQRRRHRRRQLRHDSWWTIRRESYSGPTSEQREQPQAVSAGEKNSSEPLSAWLQPTARSRLTSTDAQRHCAAGGPL